VDHNSLKSSGTSPNFFSTTASENSPTFGSPARLNATAPALAGSIYARHLFELGRPAGAPGRIALPVAGDDDAAKTVVLKLVEELGFDGVDAGGLDESWRQQPGTPVYTKDFDADGVRRGLYEASKDRTPEWRGTSNSPGSFTAPA